MTDKEKPSPSDKIASHISYLQKRNEELQSAAIDNEVLKNQLSELRSQYQEMLKQREDYELAAREKRNNILNQEEELRTDLRKLQLVQEEVQTKENIAKRKLDQYKEMLKYKNDILLKLGEDTKKFEEISQNNEKSKVELQADLENLKKTKEVLQNELESLWLLNEKAHKDVRKAEESSTEKYNEACTLQRKIDDLKTEIELYNVNIEKKKTELELAREAKNLKEGDSYELSNRNQELEKQVSELSDSLRKAEEKADELSKIFDYEISEVTQKGNELASIRENLISSDIKRLKEDNEGLKLLLEKYRQDAEAEKRLREEETFARIEIAKEKERIEREALSKDLEARSAERELARIKETHDQILEDKLAATEELNAIKEHVDLLESQNNQVFFLT